MVVDECSATTLNEKSLRQKAFSRIANASVASPASAYTDLRPESTHSRRPVRAPYSEAQIPNTATPSARIRSARPITAMSGPHHAGHHYDAAAAWYFDGHFVVSEFPWPTYAALAPVFSTATITARPAANGSGTIPV